MKEESEIASLKLNTKNEDHGFWSHHFMVKRKAKSGSSDIFYLGRLLNHCRWCVHEIKRHLLLGRKAMTNLDRVLKCRDITLLTKVHMVKAMVLPVVMYGYESWTIKKTEC